MRIAIVSYFYPPSVGGVERQTALLAGRLAARGHRVTVLTVRRADSPHEEWLDGVQVLRVPEGRGNRWAKMGGFLAALGMALARRRADLDVVQVQQALYPAAAVAACCRVLRLPVVIRNSGSGKFGAVQLMHGLPLGTLALAVMAKSATVVSLSTPMTAELKAAGFGRICEIRNGVTIPPVPSAEARVALRHELGLEGRLVLCVARLDREKGVDVLVEAWKAVRTEGARLWIVGEGPMRAELVARADARVSFLGERQDVGRLLGAADLFVLPSRSEGTSNALLEAMAAAVPCLATDVDGNRALLRPSAETSLGTLTPSEDPRAMAVQIDQDLRKGEVIVARAAAARRYVSDHLSIDTMVRGYESLYAALVG